jgi:hypothetical protein
METNEMASEINESQVNNDKQWVMLKFKNKSSSGTEFTCKIIYITITSTEFMYQTNINRDHYFSPVCRIKKCCVFALHLIN